VRGAFSLAHVSDVHAWRARIDADRARAALNQNRELTSITALIERRSRTAGSLALILSGSTARGKRTRVSDLDYHVIGARPDVRGVREDIDLYSDEPSEFMAKLRSGDDFAYWSIWYGCVLFDSGVVHEAAKLVAATDGWPDPQRKLRQARSAIDFAGAMVTSGDHERAIEEVRTALSLAARWWLLSHDVFPLARDELSDQLQQTGAPALADGLRATIHGRPGVSQLLEAIGTAAELTSSDAVAR
jgi:hypothetical protein